jgi:hypothetical protein
MATNGYSVGRDVTLAVQTPTGPVQFNKITNFQASMDFSVVRVKRIDGITDEVPFPEPWHGSFNIERADSVADDMIAALEAAYYAGTAGQSASTLTETIQEASGQVTQYVFYGVVFTGFDAGAWAGDATVKQVLKFTASRRVKRL